MLFIYEVHFDLEIGLFKLSKNRLCVAECMYKYIVRKSAALTLFPLRSSANRWKSNIFLSGNGPW